MPGTALVSVKVVPVIAGVAGVMSVEAEPMPRKILYRTAPVEPTQVRVTFEKLVPSVAAIDVGAPSARNPVLLVLSSLSLTLVPPTDLTA